MKQEEKIRKIRAKEEVLRAKSQLMGQRLNLANRKRQLEKVQFAGLRELGISPPNIGSFIQRGNDLTNDLFGLKRINGGTQQNGNKTRNNRRTFRRTTTTTTYGR